MDALLAYQNATDLDEQMDAIAVGIDTATDLDDLLEWLDTANEPRALEADIEGDDIGEIYEQTEALKARHQYRRVDLVDWTALPTFGGEAPDDTVGVWSWDAERLLVGDGWDWRIVPR